MTNFTWIYRGDEHLKLSDFLLRKGFTQILLKKVKFHGGKIFVNNKYRFTNYILSKGDKIYILLPPEPSNPNVMISNKNIEIIYEDNNFLIVNKPAHIPSVPSSKNHDDTLINRVKGYYVRKKYDNLQMHIVTRLDSDTSGLVLLAKNHLAHSILDKQLKSNKIHKKYLAVVKGNIHQDFGEINAPIGRKPPSIIERTVRSDGRSAYTTFHLLKNLQGMSVVNIQLHSGRTHQIRVHFKYINHPLIGDWLYNPYSKEIDRQSLHCKQISFYDLFNHRIVTCNAKIPLDIKKLINRYKN